MGGRSVTLKNVPARTVQGMKFPGAPYGFKMACGENPKRVYGGKGKMPSTRMGNFAVNRQTWLDALAYMKDEDRKRDLGKETLAGVLDGEILRSEEHTSELQSLMSSSSAVFCLKQ